MKNLLSNKTLQATYGGDVIGRSVVGGMLGAFLYTRLHLGQSIRTSQGVARISKHGQTHDYRPYRALRATIKTEGTGNH